jgi:hypothetical protein
VLVNFFVRRSAARYVTTFEGLDRPWRILEKYMEAIEIRELALGGAYVASGRVASDGPRSAAAELQAGSRSESS